MNSNEKKKFLNENVITQIKNSSFSFANSQHVKSYLNKQGIKVGIFHSTFIDRYKQKIVQDPLFKNRKYKYGLIVSDFNRAIKNVDKSINYLKDFSNNTILIGKNSDKYSQLGFECIDLVPHGNMVSYYKQIQYVVQDSHFEACSNVLVEASFNGCKTIQVEKVEKKCRKEFERQIIVVSENSPGVGGFGEIAHKNFNYIESNNKKLLYFNYVKSKETKDIKYFLFKNSTEYYNFMRNATVRKDIKNKFNSLNILNNTIFFVCSPYTLLLIDLYFPSHKIVYYCGSIKIKHSLKHNIFDFSKDEFLIHTSIPKILNKKNVSFISTTQLSKHYLNLFTIKKSENTFISLNDYRSSDEKIYDLIFVVSDIKRPDKNFDLCLNLFKEFPKLKKILIGKHASTIKMENLITHEFIPNNKLQDIFSKTKICIITSKMDVGPTTFVEAIQNNCIPLISRRVGFYKFTNNQYYKYACNLDNKNCWIINIKNILANYDNLKSNFCYNIYTAVKNSHCNLNKIINNCNKLDTDSYSVVVFNEKNTHERLLRLQNHILLKKSENNKNLNTKKAVSTFQLDQVSSNFTILMNDSILIYNWENYSDYKNFNELFLQYCEYPINVFNVFNSNEKIVILNHSYIKTINTLQIRNILNDAPNKINNIKTINFIDKYIGLKIKNIPKKATIGVIFIQQFKFNVFEDYLNNIIDYCNKSSIVLNVYIFYGKETSLGKYSNKNINIKY